MFVPAFVEVCNTWIIGSLARWVLVIGLARSITRIVGCCVLQEARRRVQSASDSTTAAQEAVLEVIEQKLSSAQNELDAGLASWAEGEQLYQADEIVDADGW